MAGHSTIEWTDATWNPVTGCSVVSPGCTNCYAMRLAGTRLKYHWSRIGLTRDSKAGPVWTGEVRLNEEWLTQPLQWKRPRKIFVCAHGDLFHESVPDVWIDRVFAVMALAPQHTFQVLTKRSARMRVYVERLSRSWILRLSRAMISSAMVEVADRPGRETPAWPLRNVWLGVSAEDQRRADERRDDLAALAGAGWTTFVSYEPALGPVDWTRWEFLSWLISGGESGPRPSHPDWHRTARDFCAAHGIPYLFKQWGQFRPLGPIHSDDDAFMHAIIDADERRSLILCADGKDWPDEAGQPPDDAWAMERVGKASAGRLLDGVEHNGMPAPR